MSVDGFEASIVAVVVLATFCSGSFAILTSLNPLELSSGRTKSGLSHFGLVCLVYLYSTPPGWPCTQYCDSLSTVYFSGLKDPVFVLLGQVPDVVVAVVCQE